MKNKNVIIIICVVAVIIFLMVIIGKISKNNVEITDEEKDIYILEEWEKEVLYNSKSNLTSTDKEKIKNGELGVIEKKYLKYIRDLSRYLSDKYPSYNCKIDNISYEGLFQDKLIIYFTVDGFEEKYTAHLNEDNSSFVDTFYNEIYSKENTNSIEQYVERYNIKFIVIYTEYIEESGLETKEGLSIEEIQRLNKRNFVNIYINSDSNCTLDELKAVIKEKGLFGTYIIWKSDLFKDGMTIEECKKIKDKEKNIESIVFSSWNW